MTATIRVVYQHEPKFPATDQHPDAARYNIAGYWVDAIGGQPTEADVLAIVAPSPAEADFAAAIQRHVDTTANSRGYADGVALAGYSTSTVPTWAAEAQAFIAWRDQVWMHAYTELSKVQGGLREVPTVAELIEELPAIVWP